MQGNKTPPCLTPHEMGKHSPIPEKKMNLFFAQKPNIKMNKHVNKVRKATGRAEAITAGR